MFAKESLHTLLLRRNMKMTTPTATSGLRHYQDVFLKSLLMNQIFARVTYISNMIVNSLKKVN